MRGKWLFVASILLIGGCSNTADEEELEALLDEYMNAYEQFDPATMEESYEEIQRVLDEDDFGNDEDVIREFVDAVQVAYMEGLDVYTDFLRNDLPEDYDGIYHDYMQNHRNQVVNE